MGAPNRLHVAAPTAPVQPRPAQDKVGDVAGLSQPQALIRPILQQLESLKAQQLHNLTQVQKFSHMGAGGQHRISQDSSLPASLEQRQKLQQLQQTQLGAHQRGMCPVPHA